MIDALLDVYRSIGADRYLSASELPPETADFGRRAWEVYDRCFARFTGAVQDPQFARFARPDGRLAVPRLAASRTAIVVTSATLDAEDLHGLRRLRAEVVLLADAAAAAALQRHGVNPDLVLVERPRAPGPAGAEPTLAAGTVCLIDPAAPVRGWERDVEVRRLARAWPSWGVPPATAVATAIAGGARQIALLDPGRVRPAPGASGDAGDALLSLLATLPGVRALDLAPTTSRAGWVSATWASLPVGRPEGRHRVEWQDEGPLGDELARDASDLERLEAIMPDVRHALRLAHRARAGAAVPARDLLRTTEAMLAWGCDPYLRWTLQRALGLSFLPRLWRSGVEMGAPDRLWRPLILALHELATQAQALEHHVHGRLRRTCASHAAAAAPASPADVSHDAAPAARNEPVEPSRVSVIVPVTETPRHLAEAVASLLAQDYANLEVLVVHEPEHAGACEPLRALGDPRLRFVACAGGLAHLLNSGLAHASGGLIALHGASDLSHRLRLSRQVAFLEAHGDIAVVATATRVIDAAGRPLAAGTGPAAPDTWTPEAIEKQLLFGRCFEAGSVLVRRETIEWAGGYRARRSSAPDQDLWLRLLPTARFAKLPTRLHATRAPAGRLPA